MQEIKTVGLAAIEPLVELQRITFREAYREVHAAADIEAYCNTHYTNAEAEKILTSSEFECAFAYSGGSPVGYYILKWAHCPCPLDGSSAELKQIYVRANAYGAGTGKRLYDHALNRLKEKQIDWIWLAVSDRNERAQSFYKKNGFDIKGAGPQLVVGGDILTSSILAAPISPR